MSDADGSYFENQRSQNGVWGLNPWEVIGIHPAETDPATASKPITVRGLRQHIRKIMIHVYVRAGAGIASNDASRGVTRGPRVPLWSHVNQAKDLLGFNSASDRDAQRKVAELRAKFLHRTTLTWDPTQEKGSDQAKQPPSRYRNRK